MKRNLGISALFIMLAGLMFLFAACGGGDSSSSGPAPIQYTGLTTQVAVDDTNAEELAMGAFEGGSIGGGMGEALSYIGGGGGGATSPSPTSTIQNNASEVMGMAKQSLSTGSLSAEAPVTYPPQYGTCGGRLDVTVDFNETTLAINGSFTYKNFCNEGVTTNGSMSFSGLIDMYTGDPSTMTMTFNNLSSSSATDSFAIAGNVTYTFSGSSITMSMNIKVKDAAGKVHWVKDYTLTAVPGTDIYGETFVDVTITSGRFYHPDHGYVDIQTEAGSPLRIYDDEYNPSGNPSAGVLVITGVNSSARLVCSQTGYEIYVDGNGDGYDVADPADAHIGPVVWT